MSRRERFWRYYRPYRLGLVMMAVLTFANTTLEALAFVVMAALASAIAGGNQTVAVPLVEGLELSLPVLVGIGFAIVAVRVAFLLGSRMWQIRLTTSFEFRTRMSVFEGFLRSPWTLHTAVSTARVQAIATRSVSATAQLLNTIASLLGALVSTAAMISFAVIASPAVASLALALGLVQFLVVRPVYRRIRGVVRRGALASVAFLGHVRTTIRLSKEFRIFGTTESVLENARSTAEELMHTRRTAGTLDAIQPALHQAVVGLLIFGGAAVLLAMELNDIAGFAAAGLMIVRAVGYGQGVIRGYGQIQAQLPELELLDELRELIRNQPEEPTGSGAAVPTVERVEFDGVGFVYPSGTRALREVSLDVRRGESFGVVGPSGAGKTTFIHVLMGLLQPTEGEIRVNGTPLRELSTGQWWRHLGYVPQDSVLLDDTVRANIRMLRDWITDEQIEAAAADAGILDEIRRLPNGFDTRIGEEGVRLSGGQRQRVSIARALAGQPEVLVLDEPTSSLDPAAEARIVDLIDRIGQTRMVFLITHRTTSVRNCGRIGEFRDGQLTVQQPAPLPAGSRDVPTS